MNDPTGRNKEFVREFSLYSRRIYSFVRALVTNHAEAEEVFQETSTTLWEKFDSFQPGSDFRAWAFQIAYYKVLNFRQRAARSPVVFDDQLLSVLNDEARELSDALELRSQALADCYTKLSAMERRLVDLRFADGSNVKQVAAKVGRSVDYVYKSLRRIYAVLYRCINLTTGEGNVR